MMYFNNKKLSLSIYIIISIILSVLFLDRSLAVLFHSILGGVKVVSIFAGSPTFFNLVPPFLLFPLLIRRVLKREILKFDLVLIACELSQATTQLLNFCLKMIFGRSWPLHYHPSFIADGVYQFKFFQFDPAYHSFPSGHAASISALMTILWVAYPKFRTLYAAATLAVSAALVVGDYHFLSDVLAGVSVGCFVASQFLALLRGCRPGR